MFDIGVFAVILDQQHRVLLCHRRDVDLWNLPGGELEERETPWQGVVREVREEVGLQVQVERLAGVYSKPSENEIVFSFFCRVVGGELTTSEEADQVRYFDCQELPENTAFNHRQRIKDVVGGDEATVMTVQGSSSIHLQA